MEFSKVIFFLFENCDFPIHLCFLHPRRTADVKGSGEGASHGALDSRETRQGLRKPEEKRLLSRARWQYTSRSLWLLRGLTAERLFLHEQDQAFVLKSKQTNKSEDFPASGDQQVQL